VNDWLRFSVKNVHFRTVEVTASIIDVGHITGHGHWPGSYRIIKGDIAPGETKMGHLPDHVSQSGPECTPPGNYTFKAVVTFNDGFGSETVVQPFQVTPGASDQRDIGDLVMTGSIIQKGLGVSCDDPQPSGSSIDPQNFPNEEDDGPVAVRIEVVGGATSYIAGGSDSAGAISILAIAAAAIAVLGVGSWYARRRWLGNRS